jgi:hypothetical protein
VLQWPNLIGLQSYEMLFEQVEGLLGVGQIGYSLFLALAGEIKTRTLHKNREGCAPRSTSVS